jgi:L-fuconolactonase
VAVLQRDYLPADLVPLLRATGLDGTIAVQARQTVAETEWLLTLAGQHPFIKGVVGWVDLRQPDVREQLAYLAANPRLCGVRHVVEDEDDPGSCCNPNSCAASRLWPSSTWSTTCWSGRRSFLPRAAW